MSIRERERPFDPSSATGRRLDSGGLKEIQSRGLDLWVRGWLLACLALLFRPITSLLTVATLLLGGILPVLRRWLDDEQEPMSWTEVVGIAGGIAIPPDRTARLAEYGPSIKREDAPELFAEIGRVARTVGVRMPEQIRLAGLPCCAATAWHRSRALIVGLPLFAVMERHELRSILAHELAHFAWGDVTRTARALRFLDRLSEAIDEAPLGWRRFAPARLWARTAWRIGAWLGAPIARGQEDRADRAAARAAGGPTAASALIKTAVVQPLFREAADFYRLDSGMTLFAFFREFLNRLPEELLVQMRMNLISNEQPSDDFHPPLAARVAVLQTLPDRVLQDSGDISNGPENGQRAVESAIVALGDLEALERIVHEYLFGPMFAEEGPSVFHRAYT